MAFILRSGKAQVDYFPKTASTALTMNSAVILTSGQIATAASTSTGVIGVLLRSVTASSDDYTSATPSPVLVPSTDAIFEAPVEAGTFTAAAVGSQVDLYSTTGTGIDVGSNSHKQVTIVGYINATTALVRFTGSYLFKNPA